MLSLQDRLNFAVEAHLFHGITVEAAANTHGVTASAVISEVERIEESVNDEDYYPLPNCIAY